jgi:hypothetical protein
LGRRVTFVLLLSPSPSLPLLPPFLFSLLPLSLSDYLQTKVQSSESSIAQKRLETFIDTVFTFNGFDPKITNAILTQFSEKEKASVIVPYSLPNSDPIVDIAVTHSLKDEKIPEGYEVVKKGLGGGSADINKGASGKQIFLLYKRASQVKVCLPVCVSVCVVCLSVCVSVVVLVLFVCCSVLCYES